MCDEFEIYDNTVSPRLIMIIINICFLYFKHITHTDDFTLDGYPASYYNLHYKHVLFCFFSGEIHNNNY